MVNSESSSRRPGTAEAQPATSRPVAAMGKPYLPPTLTVYGKLSEITRSTGQEGFDGFIGSRELG